MNRGVITISESGTVSMPTDTVWMTMQEIADMYNVFGCYVRKAVKAIFKDGILKEQGVRRHVRKNDRISYDVYSLELVIAVAFRIDSIESRAFREFITARSKLSTIRLRWFTMWFIHSLFLVITSLLIVVSFYC
ncbi:hypothetical protein [Prevotella sp. AM34-19LB]|nr:hypothetical protein [Prevotella sp. AM34-19LB]